MKYFKLFALLLCPMTFLASCSSNDEAPKLNTASNVTVSMGQTNISFMESEGIVHVPVVVTGEANGYVTVTCEVKEYGQNPAMADVHYYMTTQVLTIAAGDTESYFELKTVDDSQINDNRFFTITLTSIEGGSIGDPSTTVVELEDNDQFPYDRLAGEWTLDATSYGGSPVTYKLRLVPYKKGQLGYNHSYIMTGFGEGTEINVGFTYNEVTKEGSISIKYGQDIGTYDDFAVTLYGISAEGGIQQGGTVTFTWDEDFTELTCSSANNSLAALFYNSGWYIYESAMGITTLKRSY